jgi:curved DNA-binding protein CbpA
VQRDYFAVLEISPGASEQEIRAAYRRLARRYHPDLHPERPDAHQRLKEVNAAYEVLGDPVLRARYLRTRRVQVRIQADPRPAPATQSRPAAPPPPPPPTGYVVFGSHVDLSGGRTGWRAYGDGSYSGIRGRPSGSARSTPLDDDELAVLYVRRLLRALFGW